MRELGELDDRHVRGEAGDLKVGAVHFEQCPAFGRQGSVVIVRVRAVRRADLDDSRARARHDVGNSERSADFDQLAAGHDHFPAVRHRSQHDHRRRRVVVDHHSRLGADDFREVELNEFLVPGEAVAPPLWLVREPVAREVQRADPESPAQLAGDLKPVDAASGPAVDE